METKSRIFFVNERLQKDLEELKIGKTEEQELYRRIVRAFNDLINHVYCGIQIPKRLIPGAYIKRYKIDNLWKYDLPGGWRLLYSVGNEDIEVLAIILEWLDHKNYERRFNY